MKLQEAKNQIIIDYEVYAQRPQDAELLIPAITVRYMQPSWDACHDWLPLTPGSMAKARGVKRVCIPNHGSKSPSRKREQKKRWFRNGQRWRTGCEGRISVSKRRHGLQRCRYRGAAAA